MKSYLFSGLVIDFFQISSDSVEPQLRLGKLLRFGEGRLTPVKFSSFVSKNSDCPFHIKRQVWLSALTSSIFYGCESWLTSNLKMLDKPFMASLKQMLGVRNTTCNDVTLLEIGQADAKGFVQNRQSAIIKKLDQRSVKSYIHDIMNLAVESKSQMGLQLKLFRAQDKDYIQDSK